MDVGLRAAVTRRGWPLSKPERRRPRAAHAGVGQDRRVPRILTILGSGETSPTMVTPHQRTFARLGAEARGVLLDSPYGFQENADELTEKAQQYFPRAWVASRGRRVPERASSASAASARARDGAAPGRADWIFAGPG